jgi:glucan phosphoethanolaminetransferase (alkaline phosphatase superfamily)
MREKDKWNRVREVCFPLFVAFHLHWVLFRVVLFRRVGWRIVICWVFVFPLVGVVEVYCFGWFLGSVLGVCCESRRRSWRQ